MLTGNHLTRIQISMVNIGMVLKIKSMLSHFLINIKYFFNIVPRKAFPSRRACRGSLPDEPRR
jgi:hypothetical protein